MSDDDAFELEKVVMLKVPGDMDVLRYIGHCRELRTIAKAAVRMAESFNDGDLDRWEATLVGKPDNGSTAWGVAALRAALKSDGRGAELAGEACEVCFGLGFREVLIAELNYAAEVKQVPCDACNGTGRDAQREGA